MPKRWDELSQSVGRHSALGRQAVRSRSVGGRTEGRLTAHSPNHSEGGPKKLNYWSAFLGETGESAYILPLFLSLSIGPGTAKHPLCRAGRRREAPPSLAVLSLPQIHTLRLSLFHSLPSLRFGEREGRRNRKKNARKRERKTSFFLPCFVPSFVPRYLLSILPSRQLRARRLRAYGNGGEKRTAESRLPPPPSLNPPHPLNMSHVMCASLGTEDIFQKCKNNFVMGTFTTIHKF